MHKVSVVIPCRNEVKFIEECIHAIYDSQIEPNIQLTVFVVDGMSDDGTRDVIQHLKHQYSSLHLVDNTKKLTPYAFNLGIYQDPSADFIQIVGARHILSNNYIQTCINQLEADKTTWCVGGKIINEYINKKGEYIAKAMGTTFGMGLGNFRTLSTSGYTDTVTSPMYPKWVFEKIGYFDEQLIRNQDDDYNYRVSKAGGKIFFESTISLKYYVRGNYSNLWKQFLQYGYWKVFVNKKHHAITTIRQLVPPMFLVFLVLLPFLFLMHNLVGLAGLFTLACYILLALVFSAKVSNNLTSFLNVLIIYPILHISYGWGYLRGIITFILFRKEPKSSFSQLSR
jgi:GT2 family glycosyltransferase